MAKFENFEKYDMFCCYITQNKNPLLAGEEYLNRFPERRQPHIETFARLDKSLSEFGSFSRPRGKNYMKNEEKELLVLATVAQNNQISLRQIEAEVGVSKTCGSKILKKQKYHPYKWATSQVLHPGDAQRRIQFCEWYLRGIAENPQFAMNILWTDECNFTNCGMFNRKNCHIWAQENPHNNFPVRNQVRFSVNVFCGLLGNRLMGPVMFEGNLSANRYVELIENNVEDFLDDLPLAQRNNTWYQQDGAPAHNSRVAMNCLRNKFGNQLISTNSDTPWPARSPDITPLDFFFWGFIKTKMYMPGASYNNREELCDAINNAFDATNRNTLRRVINSIEYRCRMCLNNNGNVFEQFL